MRLILLFLLGISLSSGALAAGLDIEVDGFGPDIQAGLMLYSSRFGFPDEPRESQSAGVRAGTAEWHFDDLPPGDYAVLIWGDEDEDGKFDRSMFGNPKERFVFSNGVYEDEPDWDSVRFTIGGGRTQIKLTVREP